MADSPEPFLRDGTIVLTTGFGECVTTGLLFCGGVTMELLFLRARRGNCCLEVLENSH